MDHTIAAEITPNPNTLKFNIGKTLVESGTLNYTDRERAKGVVLAETLYEISDVLGVMIGRDFVTVTKKPDASWHTMAQPIIDSLKTLITSGKELVPAGLAGVAPAAEAGVSANSEIERKIREILDAEIRPAVAMDGGDIQFYGYDNGVVTLHLQGSCSSCPSSVMTLKMGVENRLKSLIPEVREVVQV